MRFTRTPARLFASACALAGVTLALYLSGGAFERGLSVTLSSAVVALTVGVVTVRTSGLQRHVYRMLFAAFALLTATNVTWTVAVGRLGHDSSPEPVADIVMVLAYAFLLAAAVMSLAPSLRRDSGGALDAATVGVGVAVGLWLLLIGPSLPPEASAQDRAYILTVVLLLGACIGVILGVWTSGAVHPRARPSLAYFAASVAFAVAGNVLTALYSDASSAGTTWWTGLPWPLSYAAAWAAVAHPAGASAFQVGERSPSRLTPARIAMLALALALGPLIGIGRASMGREVDWLTAAVAQVVIIAMVLTRVGQIAHAHRSSEAQLQILADGDPLTGLANRRAVSAHLEDLAARVAAGQSRGVVVCFMDLNGFKEVNDTHGHAVGDELLEAVAGRLAASVRFGGQDMVGRLGGDEFIVVFEGGPDAIAASAQARVENVFASPFQLSVGPVEVRTSIGVSTARSGDSVTVDELLTRADHAMYTHKRAGDAERG